MNADIPVLIVGAGPVGLTMAAFLHHHGIQCRIIDKRAGPTQTSNALAIHARTMELLSSIGILDSLCAKGKKVPRVEIGSDKKAMMKLELEEINSDYNYILCIPQCETEAVLIDHLKSVGIEVERDCELIDLRQDFEICYADIQNSNSDENNTITSEWLIGCDGYHSATRDQLKKVSYDGSDMQLSFAMIDAEVETDKPELLQQITIYSDKDLSLMLFPMQNCIRIAAEISRCHRYDAVGEVDEAFFDKIIQSCLPYSISIQKILWTSKFWIHERIASQFRCDRIFLAGDAAHAHSPAGGQGMNTGMQDAINLAWKLALVIQDKADNKILNSYDIERRPVAMHVIANAGKLTRMMTVQSGLLTTVRNTIMPLIASFSPVKGKVINQLAELDIAYNRSPLNIGKKSSTVRPGDLCPIRKLRNNTECVLLNFIDDSTEEHNGIKMTQGTEAQSQALGLKESGYCLIRPDGYIAYVGKEKPTITWLKA